MKTKNENRILFCPGGCITRRALEWFIDNKLTEAEIKKLKHHARKCELCADSLEGAQHFESGATFNSRINNLHESKWRRSIDKRGNTRKLFYGITTAAASVVLLFGIYYLFKMKQVIELNKSVVDVPKQTEQVLENDNVLGKSQKPLIETEPSQKSIKSKSDNPINKKEEVIRPKEEIVISEPEIQIEEKSMNFEPMLVEELAELEISKNKKVSNSDLMPTDNFGYVKEVPLEDEAEQKETAEEHKTARSKTFERRIDKNLAKQAYYVAEVKPLFKGGSAEEFSKYIADSLKVILPDTILTQSIVIGFRIDTMGNVDRVNLISGTDSKEFNNQIINIIENSPQWIPASISGHPVISEQQIKVVLKK